MKLFLIAFAVIAAVSADVSHLPSNDYLPPTQQYENVEHVQFQSPSNDYLPPVQQHQQVEYQSAPVEAAPAHVLADDGYQYRTNRRRVVLRRHRRDVSHLPSNDYLPPTQQHEHVEQVQFQTPSNEYLAPVQHHQAPVQEVQYQAPVQQVQYQAPVQQVHYQAPVEVEPAHELADDGYHYQTHRRVVVRRNRRDVSHLPSNDYLPPTQQYQSVEQVQYQTPSNDYLPPVQQYQAPVQQYQAPVQQYQQVQYQAPVEAEPAHELTDEGYRYKTHRRRVVVRRNRRDVSHLPSNDYLPPTQQYQSVEQVQYQTPSNDYLPPVQHQAPVEQYQQVQYQTPVQQYQQVQYQTPIEAEPAHELAQDGYHYKTHRRRVVVRRNRRDVSHLPTSEYLPPSQEVAAVETPAYNYSPVQENTHVEQVQQVEIPAPVEAEPAHELAQDGYHYQTHRRVVYRRH